MTTSGVRLRTTPTAVLSPTELGRLRALLDTAFDAGPDAGFGDDDWAHALGGVHVVATVDGTLVGHASVVVRRLTTGDLTLRTGYVEAVATAPSARRSGIGWAVMAEVERVVADGFELGALSASPQALGLYAARGWERWRGDTAACTPAGLVDSPDEAVFVLRTPATPAALDPATRLVCDWRRGDLW